VGKGPEKICYVVYRRLNMNDFGGTLWIVLDTISQNSIKNVFKFRTAFYGRACIHTLFIRYP
jgi:hypothetical protein